MKHSSGDIIWATCQEQLRDIRLTDGDTKDTNNHQISSFICLLSPPNVQLMTFTTNIYVYSILRGYYGYISNGMCLKKLTDLINNHSYHRKVSAQTKQHSECQTRSDLCVRRRALKRELRSVLQRDHGAALSRFLHGFLVSWNAAARPLIFCL